MTQRWIEDRLSQLPGKNKIGLARALEVHHSRISEILGGRRQVKTTEIPAMAKYLEMAEADILRKLSGRGMAFASEWFTSRMKSLGISIDQAAEAMGLGQDIPTAIKILSGVIEFRPTHAEPLADLLKVPVNEILRHAGIGSLADGSDAYQGPEQDPEAAEKARRSFIIATITDDPDLFVSLRAEYRALYAAEGVPITESQLAALVLSDYAELVLEPRESRPMMAKGLVAAQRRWLQANKANITAP